MCLACVGHRHNRTCQKYSTGPAPLSRVPILTVGTDSVWGPLSVQPRLVPLTEVLGPTPPKVLVFAMPNLSAWTERLGNLHPNSALAETYKNGKSSKIYKDGRDIKLVAQKLYETL